MHTNCVFICWKSLCCVTELIDDDDMKWKYNIEENPWLTTSFESRCQDCVYIYSVFP